MIAKGWAEETQCDCSMGIKFLFATWKSFGALLQDNVNLVNNPELNNSEGGTFYVAMSGSSKN